MRSLETSVVTRFYQLAREQAQNLASEPPGTLAITLAHATAEAEKQWPTLKISREVFLEHVARRLPKDATDITLALTAMHLDHLYLACACLLGGDQALACFENHFLSRVDSALANMDKTGALTDEAKQLLRRRLFVTEDGRPGKIADYLGQGDLSGWVRAAAVRIGLDLLRSSKRDSLRQDEDILAALPDVSQDPELKLLKDRYGNQLKAAFAQTLQHVAGKDRSILRYHYVDALTIDEIGAIFGVHRTTAFRWIETARHALVTQTRRHLQAELGASPEELESVMRLLTGQFDLSLERLLGTRAPK